MTETTSPRSSKSARLTFLAVLAATIAVPGAWIVLAGGVTPNGTQPPVTHDIEAPGNCLGCHSDYDLDNNVEPWNTWAGSMMANAGRDPLFWAALDVANNDLPGAGDFCLRCHAPKAWLAGRVKPPGGTPDGCGLLGDLDGTNNDFEGISCHFCHRMMVNESPPPGEDPVYFENGQYWIDDEDCSVSGSGPCRRGPYGYEGPEIEPPHEWAYSAYHESSDICGNCHNVTSPVLTLIDTDGQDTGLPFPIERTFKEWQQSDYSPAGASFQTCQNCHMPDATQDPVYACFFEDNNRTGNMPMHVMAGGNTWIPAVLQGEYPALERGDELTATIAAANDMLQNQSAALELTSGAATPGEDLVVEVKVTNLTGHKLPTGYPEGRRMWLNVAVRDGDDVPLWEGGAYDPATGELTEDGQIKIYRVEPGIWNLNGTGQCDADDAGGSPLFHFALNNCIVVDNRIPPLGFSGMSDLETQPVGYSYPETSSGSGILVNFDVTEYQIPIPVGAAAPITVEATLYYQTASREYVEFLRDQAVDNDFPDDCISGTPAMSRGEILHDMWERYDRSPPVGMVSDTAEVGFAEIFSDGFESGDTTAWSASVP